MAFYVDSSAFVKLVVKEAHTTGFRRWAEANEDRLFSSDLLRTEVLRVARRYSLEALAEARRRLEVLTLMALTADVFERAAELDPAIMRTLDAVHLAAALTVADELEGLVTYDERMAEAASFHGVAVLAPR
jgi:predicted nucleic acid-binding protein